MIKDQVQKQEAGDGSTNLQGNSIVIHQGISYADAKEIALDVYKANYLILSEDAAKLAVTRAEELTDNFLNELKSRNEEAIDTMSDPGMLMALYSAQKEYARTGDADLQKLLVDILVERASARSRDIKQIVLDESLVIAPKLTPEQYDVLTLSWMLTKTKVNTIGNLETFENCLDKYILPFVGTLTDSSSCYEHLQYLGCGDIVQLGRWGKIEVLFRDRYPGVFCKGLKEEDIQKEFEDLSSLRGMIVPCLHDKSTFQVAAMDVNFIEQEVDKRGVDKMFLPKLKKAFEKSRMNENEVREYILNIRPSLKILFEIWEKTPLQRLTLTTVGYAIAQANFRRRTGEQVDLSIWVK
ncbi:MAG: hypothetical protein JW902_02555 [Syntrophaceae bacterium]|nr:hypothetical protein [Syntrophaceae bacterium]